MSTMLKEHSQITFSEPMVAPWLQFPEYPRLSMGWRMGAGEDYMVEFRTWISALDAETLEKYQSQNEEPEGWAGFYGSFGL